MKIVNWFGITPKIYPTVLNVTFRQIDRLVSHLGCN